MRIKNPDLQTLIKNTVEEATKDIPNPLYDPEDILSALLQLKCDLIKRINKAIVQSNVEDNHAKWPTITDFSKWGTFIIKEVIYSYYEVYCFTTYKGDPNGIGLVFSKTSTDPNEVLLPLVNIAKAFAGAWLIPGTYKKIEDLTQIYLYDQRVIEYINDGKHDPDDKLMSIPAANGVVIRNKDGSVRELISYREAKARGLLYNIIFPWKYLGQHNPVPEIPDDMAPNGIWKPDEWIEETHSGDKDSITGFYNMLLGVISIYDTKHWKCMFILRDAQDGNTGKSTEMQLCRNIVGNEHVADLSMVDFSKSSDFALEPLANNDRCLVTWDENDPNIYIEKVGPLKCACTTDPFTINRKRKPIVSYVHRGRVIQGYNGVMRTGDNTDSFYRRLRVIEYFVKFGKDKPENTKIKSEWINRQEVLDYLGTEAINRNVLDFPNMERQDEIIDEMKTQNDSVKRFFDECVEEMMQNHFTLNQLYPAFVKFCKETGAMDVGDTKFKTRAKTLLAKDDSSWTFTPRNGYPNALGTARVEKHHIPFNKVIAFEGPKIKHQNYEDAIYYTGCLRDDPIFDMLFNAIKTNRTSDSNRTVQAAFDNLYKLDTKKSDKIYYRKPEAEKENLKRVYTYFKENNGAEVFLEDVAKRLEELGAWTVMGSGN